MSGVKFVSRFLQGAAVCALLTAPTAPVALAQETSALGGSSDVIVVTARRKEESLLDVPLPVVAFSDQAIQEAGFQDFDDIILLAPGVFNSTSGGRSDRVTIRGFSQVSTTGGSNAGIFIDGVFVSGPVTALDLENLERVEIVKGPQSAQFGRGTLAGAVNYVTRRPGDEAVGRIKLTAATLEEYAASGFWAGPVSDEAGIMVSASIREKGSEFFNTVSQREDLGGESEYAFGAGATWEPKEDLSFYVRMSYSDISSDPIGIYTQGPEFNNCNLTTTRQYYCGEVEIDYGNIRNITSADTYIGGTAGTDRETFRVALIGQYDIADNQSIESITSWQNEDERWGSDATNRGIAASQLLPNGPAVDISRDWTDFSQELRYRGTFAERYELLLGAYYFDSERDEIATYIPDDRGTVSEENWAIFGSLEVTLADNFHITGEIRYQEDDISLDDADSNLFVDASFDAVLPRITIDYEPTDDLMFYAIYAEGNKPGSVNTRLLSLLDPALIPIDEEENVMYEIGSKGRLFDNRIQYTLAGYFFEWTNQQLTQQCDPPQCGGSVTYTDNIGETEIWGAELDLSAVLVPDFWDVRFTAAWNDAEIEFLEVVGTSSTEAEAAAFGFPVDPVDGDGIIVSGTPAPASPEWTFSVSSNMSAPLAETGFDWFLRADYSWIDEQFASVFGQASSGDRQNLNLRAGVENEAWRLEAWGTNLTDDETPLALVRTVRFDGTLNPFDAFPSPIQRSFSAIIPEGQQFGVTVTRNF